MMARLVLGMLLASGCLATADEIPSARWYPGVFATPDIARFSSNAKFVTMSSYAQTIVIDMDGDTCVLVLDYLLQNTHPTGYFYPVARTAVSESGNELVVVDTTGAVNWYHVGEGAPWMTQQLDSGRYSSVNLINDTLASVAMGLEGEEGSAIFSVHDGAVQKIPSFIGRFVSDSLSVFEYGTDSSIVFDTRSQLPLFTLQGTILGYSPENDLVVRFSDTLSIHDARTGAMKSKRGFDTWSFGTVIRHRFVRISTSVYDLLDEKNLAQTGDVSDLLWDRTSLVYHESQCKIRFLREDVLPDSLTILDGPVKVGIQHPRDSTIYAATYAESGDLEQGHYGHMVGNHGGQFKIFDTGYEMKYPFVTALQPFRLVKDTLVTEYAGGTYDRGQGLLNFDRHTALPSYVSVALRIANHEHHVDKLFYRFSERGDTLISRNDSLHVRQCTYRKLPIAPANFAATGFVTGTQYYVASDIRYSILNCADTLRLPWNVISIAPTRDRVLAQSGDTLVLTTISDPAVRSATTLRPLTWSDYWDIWWADSAATLRMTGNRKTITSIYSDGRVDTLILPPVFSSRSVTWMRSHDGRVITCRTHDTIVSIDIETGSILREYYDAPWLKEFGPVTQIRCIVGDIDGSLIVSLPGGCTASFPGISLLTPTRIDDAQCPLRPLQLHGTRIEGATPQSSVTVYSLLGTVVFEGVVDGNGEFDIADRGLPHGAYFVVCRDTESMQSVCVIQ